MERQGTILKILFLSAALNFFLVSLKAATYTSVTSGNWNSPATWGSTSFPVTGDNVNIAAGHTITVTAAAACASITFTGTSGILTVNASTTLTVSGTITLNNLANSNSACTVTGAGTISCANIAVGSNTNPTSANTYTHTLTAAIAALNISGNITITSSVGTNTNRRGNGTFNLESGTVSISGSISTVNENNVNASTFSMASGTQSGTLVLRGSSTFSASGTGTTTITLNGTDALVNYNYTGAQTVYYSAGTSTTNYTNITLSGTGVKSLPSGLTVSGTLSVEGTATTSGTTPSYGSSSAIRYRGTSPQTTGIELPSTFSGSGGLIIDNSAGVSMSASQTLETTLTLTSGAFSVGANTLSLNGPAIAGNGANLLTTTSSNLSFGGSSAGVFIPSGISNLRNLTINNSNGVAMNSNITLASDGTLALNSGILNAGAYTLSLTNTSSAAIAYTAGSFVNVTTGSLQRTLPSSLTGIGNNYLFPIGESNSYKGLNLVDVNTGTTGPVIRASVSATGALTGDNSTIGPVDPRYWSLINTNSGNLTSARIELFETGLDETKTIGTSTAVSGNYVAAGGSLNPSSIVSPPITSFRPYFCIGTIWIDTYYSYQTGNWNTSTTWTSDPSGTLQIGTSVPGDGDRVIILSDRTVSLTADVTASDLDLTIESGGILDQAPFRFTNTLKKLSGQGTVRLASVNFPGATLSTFIESGGGTTEYYNSSDFTIPASTATYNNLTINCSGQVATLLSNLTLYGNLYVKSGTFRINNNISTTKLNLTINGNVTVDSGASLTVGNGVTNPAIGSSGSGGTAPFLNYYLNFHTVIISGDLTNNGTVKFTNLAYPLYTAFPPTTAGATSGAASVYFQGAGNNTITCNGTTDFYNLIVNKGTDQTFKLTINSSAYSNFRLFGANSLAAEALTANPTQKKALWIYNGTLVLKGRLAIPSLSEGVTGNADYYIPANGAIVIDGVDVAVLGTADDFREVNLFYGTTAPDNTTTGITKGGKSAINVFGKLEVNNGFLSTRESGGIVTTSTASGQVIINGGIVDSKQLLGSTGSASYTQTGGLFILRGRLQRIPSSYAAISNITDVSAATLGTSRITNGINTGFGSFNLENTSNIFNVSGGTIRIYDVTLNTGGKAFDVKSSLSNINVTGGSLEISPVTGTALADSPSFLIYSTAPVYDLKINNLSSTSVTGLSTALSVLNDISLTSGGLTANNFSLSAGGDFLIETGTAYTPGTNTTIFNGSGKQTFTVNTAAALSLYALTIAKSAGDSIIMAGTQNMVNISNNFNLTLGTLVDGGKTLNLSGSSIYNSGIHSGTGTVVLNGTVAQTIGGGGIFQNVTLNNTSGTAVGLASNMTINGILTFANNALFNIGTYNLRLNAAASVANYGANRYIQTAGNAGDGGLTRVFSSTAALTFPVGAPTINPARVVKYTPATIGFTSAPATFGSVTVIPVGYENANTTTKGQSLTYYWRVKSSGFTGIQLYSVTHSFVYGETDIAGTETNYVPSLYDESAHLWYYGTTSSINTTSNTISDWAAPTNSTNFLDADYTAGLPSGFGTPRIFYSRRSGLWSALSTWSLTSHTVDNQPTVVPGANDIVLIGGQDSVYLATNNTTANTGVQNCATLQIESGSALDIGYNPGCTFAMVRSNPSGNGNFRLTTNYNSPSTFAFPSGDFSDFNVNRGTTELYTTNPTAGTEYYMPTGITSFGNLILSPLGGSNLMFPNNSVTIYGNLVTRGQNADSWFVPSWGTTYPGSVPTVAKTITIMGDMDIQGGALIWYQNSNIAQNFVIYGNVRVGRFSSLFVYSGATNQSMAIGGSLINNANGLNNGVSTNSKADFTNIPVTFFGPNSAFITNTIGTPSTTFGSVIVNKGNSQATTLTCNIAGTLTTPANNWLTLQNGTFIYNRTGNLTISQGTDFTIPATSGLVINTTSNVYFANTATSNKTLFLNGRLAIMGGNSNVYVGPQGNTANNADIEYSGSGSSQLDIQSGNIYVNGQIRRPLASTNGILNYSQSGGNVFIYGNNPQASNLVKAKLEVLNAGSSFNMSGGTLTIIRGGGTTFGDLYLRPSVSSVTGGTILFTQAPASGPVVDAAQLYTLDANITLNNLSIAGKTTGISQNSTLTLMVSPLALNGSLSIENNLSTLNSNNLNIFLKGDFNNNGTYTCNNNLTTFNGGIQQITGSSVTNFYNLIVSSLTSLTVNRSFSVEKDLTINSGNLVLGSNRVSLLGNLINNGSYIDDNNTGGIVLAGTGQQRISGTGLFGLLDLNNSQGARLYSDINLRNNLVLTNGILDINIYLLTLSQTSAILGAPFSVNKMIRIDGVISCFGVKKFFNAGAQNFTFPVGVSGKYTPAVFSISASSSVGYIRVNPINNSHPSISDPLNALKYYWQIENSGITGIDATVQLQYSQDDVFGTESSYVAARLELPANIWNEALPGPSTDNVDETGNQVSFTFTSANNLNGDYTAGNADVIPGEVPSYQTISDGLWSNAAIWAPIGASPACPAGGPSGAVVIVNHVVTVNTNRIYVFSTTINNRLMILSPTYGHNLGYVTGNGTLYVESGNIPGGNYSGFTDCAGNGTIEYGGTGSYSIIATLFNNLPNARFSGTGLRILPNKDLTICSHLIIDGPTLDNSVNNRRLFILGTMERYNTGIFKSGSGVFPAATVTFSGTSVQSLGGATGNFTGASAFWNFEINNSAGLLIGNGGAVEISNNLLLTSGIITTSSTATVTLLNTMPSAVIPEGGNSTSYISGPLTKYLLNGDEFIYPLGKGQIKAHQFSLISAAGLTMPFTVEFFTPNSTATTILAPLKVANTAEYWSVKSSSPTTAKVRIAWDPQSDLTPLMAANGLSDMRIARYLAGQWTEMSSIAAGDVNNGTVETLSGVAITASESDFTSACTSGTLARASFSAPGYICGTSGIQLSFTSFTPISLNYVIGYTIDGNAQTPVTVSTLPFTLPAPSPGVYKLTSFTFNNGSGTGVVDAQTVTVYATPSSAAAGSDQSRCGESTATLQGNNPAPYSGLWTIVSGTGGSFVSNTLFNTTFNGVLGNTYTLRWTISNGPCTSSDDVVISFPVVASTPGDFTSSSSVVCQGSTGNIFSVPSVGGIIYTWSYTGTGQTIHGTGNAVSIDFSTTSTGGTLSVTATNNCGTSSPRSIDISIPSAGFSYSGSPYCQNGADPLPVLGAGSTAGLFTSTPGLVFANSSTGQIDLSASNTGTYTVTNTVLSGTCGTLTATATVTIAGLTWNGAASSDWNTEANWSCGYVPYPTTHAVIPNVARKPVLNTGITGTVNNLTIESGSSLILSGGKLKVSGTITNNGTFDASAGTIEMNGSSSQVIGAGIFTGNTVQNLTVSNASGVTLLGPLNATGIVLVESGDLSSGGFLTLVSSASGTALIDGSGNGTVSGNVTMQRYLESGFGYKYFSSPFTNATVGEFDDDRIIDPYYTTVYRYNENNIVSGMPASGWVEYETSSNSLIPLSGYAVNFGDLTGARTVDVTGVVNNGIISATFYNHNQVYTKGFNLAGNPYPSPIDWTAPSGWTKTNIDNALYFFKASSSDPYGGRYSTWVNGISSDDTVSNIIPSMQGFFIHVSDGPPWPVTATLALDNNTRVTGLTQIFAKSGEKKPESLLRLTATLDDNPASADPLVIYFDEKAAKEFDSGLDALKLINTDYYAPSLYSFSSDSKRLSINAIPERNDTITSIPLGITTSIDGYLKIKLTDAGTMLNGWKIYLSDLKAGVEYDLIEGDGYRIFLDAGEYNDRFVLNLTPVATGIPETKPDDIFSVYSFHGIVKSYIDLEKAGDGYLRIFNLAGQLLFVERITETGYNEFNPGLKDGIYIANFTSGKYRVSRKLYISNR